jgi:hypothetical protein
VGVVLAVVLGLYGVNINYQLKDDDETR